MEKRIIAFAKVGFSFFIWSLLGPILNLSPFTAVQTIWGISILACSYLLLFAYHQKKFREFKVVRLDFSLSLFMIASGISGVLWLQSLTLIPIAQAVLLYSIVPIFTFILGYLFLKEGAQITKILALILGFLGIAVILSVDLGNFAPGKKFFFGVIAVLAAAFLTATQAVIAKKFSLHYPTWITVFLIMLAQTIIATPFAFSNNWSITPFALAGTIFLSIFSSIIAFLFYINGFRFLKSSTVTLVGYIEPFLVAIWGYLFLQQILTINTVLGGILVLVAGYITIRSEER